PGLGGNRLGLGLAAKPPHGIRRWPDEGDARLPDGLSKEGVLGEKTISGVDGVRSRNNSNRFHAELTRGADDANGDLAAIGNEDFLEHGGTLIASPLPCRQS